MKYILDCFDYNQHFVAMMNIINYAKLTNKDGKFEKHHIIPRCWFNKHNLLVDNSENNLVNLTIEQHRKVHKLAVLCAKEEIKSSLKYASSLMNRESICGEKNPNYGVKCDEEKRNKISNSVKQAYKDGRLNTNGENNGMYGKHSWCNGKHLSDETKHKISETKKNNITPEYRQKLSEIHKGKKLSEETKKKISEANKRRIVSNEAKKKISEAKKEYWKTHKLSSERAKEIRNGIKKKKEG